jgi:hypothetical protein
MIRPSSAQPHGRPGSARPARAPRRLAPLKVAPERPKTPAEAEEYVGKLEQHYLTVREKNLLAEQQQLQRLEKKRLENPDHVVESWGGGDDFGGLGGHGGHGGGPRGRRRKSLLSGPPRNLAVEILLLQFLSLVCGLLALSLPWYEGHVDEAEAKAVADSGAELKVGDISISAARTCIGEVCEQGAFDEAEGRLGSLLLLLGTFLLGVVLLSSLCCPSCRNRCTYGCSAGWSASSFGCATVAVALIQMPSSFRVAPAGGDIALIFAMLFSTLGAVLTYKHIDPWVEEEKKERGEAVVDQRGNITMVKTIHV